MRPPKKAAKAKAKPKPKDTRPQRARFEEAAERVGVDGAAFDRAMDKITPPRKVSTKPS